MLYGSNQLSLIIGCGTHPGFRGSTPVLGHRLCDWLIFYNLLEISDVILRERSHSHFGWQDQRMEVFTKNGIFLARSSTALQYCCYGAENWRDVVQSTLK
jgi:hypothetical protein